MSVHSYQRQPPLTPDVFDATLRMKHFALETDRPAVERKYAQTFHEVMASAKFLEFQAGPPLSELYVVFLMRQADGMWVKS